MWTLKENANGTWTAQHYTTKLVDNKIVKVIKGNITGTEREALEFLLSFEYISHKELLLAMKNLMDTGDDTAHFGVLGGFMWTSKENVHGEA